MRKVIQNSTARIITDTRSLVYEKLHATLFSTYSVVRSLRCRYYSSHNERQDFQISNIVNDDASYKILTSFVFCGTLAENSSVIDGIVKKNTRTLEYASSESFAHNQRPVHVVIGQRKNRSVIRCISNHLKQNRREGSTKRSLTVFQIYRENFVNINTSVDRRFYAEAISSSFRN